MTVLQADGTLPGRVWDSSQFQIGGVGGGCGVAALASAEGYGQQSYRPFVDEYHKMRASGQCDAVGKTVMGELETQAHLDGFKTDGYPHAYPSPAAWQAWAFAHLDAGRPVIYETSRAQSVNSKGQITAGLHDLLTGARMDAGRLDFHYATMVGKWGGGYNSLAKKDLPAGVWVLDSDSDATNPVVGGKRTRVIGREGMRQFYALADMGYATLYDLLAIYPKVAIGPVAPAMPDAFKTFLAIPEVVANGWRYGSYNGVAALIAKDGTPVIKGFALWLCANSWAVTGKWADNGPLKPERGVAQVEGWNTAHGAGTVQTFHRMRLCWTPKDGCYAMWLGDAVEALEQATGRAA